MPPLLLIECGGVIRNDLIFFQKSIDIRPYIIYYICTDEREVMKMSPKTGRPTSNKKTERFEVRMTPDEAQLLQECAERLEVSRTDVINKGVRLVKAELDEEK